MEFMHSTRGGDDSWRMSRLEKVVGIFCDIYGVSRDQVRMLVSRLWDQKGDLRIEWYHEPTARQREAMELAWRFCGEPNVEHSVFSGDVSVAADRK